MFLIRPEEPPRNYLVHSVLTDDHADPEVFIDHRQGAVLELPGHDAFAMHVRQLLDLQRAFQAGRKVESSTHDEQRLLLVDIVSDLRDRVVQLEDFSDHL